MRSSFYGALVVVMALGPGTIACESQCHESGPVPQGDVSGAFSYTEAVATSEDRALKTRTGVRRLVGETPSMRAEYGTSEGRAQVVIKTNGYAPSTTFTFDVPSHAGVEQLSKLRGKLCDSIYVYTRPDAGRWSPSVSTGDAGDAGDATEEEGGGHWVDVCADVSGTVEFHAQTASPTDGEPAFNATLTFASSAPSEGPSLRGSAQVHYFIGPSVALCGPSGSCHGPFAPE